MRWSTTARTATVPPSPSPDGSRTTTSEGLASYVRNRASAIRRASSAETARGSGAPSPPLTSARTSPVTATPRAAPAAPHAHRVRPDLNPPLNRPLTLFRRLMPRLYTRTGRDRCRPVDGPPRITLPGQSVGISP
ncbi:hypothetical protein SGFS_061570 [Streptomyces graminofaciens]|uniref:Uncharacterized protein n=1 Tax=Streptomyces graminofaciens TaxID=68212 RepID=A0ABN5VP07_9ACTN|nr:hypothetical protein SGFS_061570 [Streptomyces graminofaciens]